MENSERLQKYKYDDYTVVVNFETYEDAIEYHRTHGGELIEVGFKDGSDNPTPDASARLAEHHRAFAVELPSEYQVIYSDSEQFQELSEDVLYDMKEKENDMAPEDILADQNIAPGDRIVILKDGEVNTVTTRERIKYLMSAILYELAVKVPNTEE